MSNSNREIQSLQKELAQFNQQATHTSFTLKYIEEMNKKRQRLKYLLGETSVDPYVTNPLVTIAPTGHNQNRNNNNKGVILGTLVVAGLIGYAVGDKYKRPMVGALIGAYIPTFIGGNFARNDTSLTRGISEAIYALTR